MAYDSTTTLNRIRAARPCRGGWEMLLAHLGKSAADDEPLPLLTVLDSNGFDDALWVLAYAMPDDRLNRHFAAWCAEQVLPLFEAKYPDDDRPRRAIAVARDDSATPEQRAAARDAARAAAGDAACAAGTAAWAAGASAGDAAGAAAGTAGDAGDARASQERQLRAMINGEVE